MKTELEPADIKAIADAVIQQLTPLLAELKVIAAITPKPQQIQALTPHPTVKPRQDMLKRGDLQAITGISVSTISRMEGKGRFPSRVQLSEKRVGWHRSEVEAWAEGRRQAA